MWRSKKFIIAAVLAAVLLAGGISGMAIAQSGNGDDIQPKTKRGALLERACQIYQEKTGVVIDKEVLKDAFVQAVSEMRPKLPQNRGEMIPGDMPKRPRMDPQDMQNWLQKLVQQGKITQEQADQFLRWWQSKPDTTQFEQQIKQWQEMRPQIPPELKQWIQARPQLPLGFRPREPLGGPCPPPQPAE